MIRTFLLLALAMVTSACAIIGNGDGPSRVRVADVDYTVGVVRGIDVSPAELTAGAPIDSADDERQFAEMTTYELDGVDPHAFLLAPANPAHDDGGPIGPYLALWGPEDPFPEVCRYFPAALESRPTEC